MTESVADTVVVVVTEPAPVSVLVTTIAPSTAVVAAPSPVAAATVAEQGQAGPPGEPGPPGVAAATIIQQSAPSASWIVPHTLGRRPFVQVMLPSGEVVLADVVSGEASVSVAFAQPATGSLILI